MAKEVKIGWYNIEESFEADGTIDMAIRDKRTGELIAFEIHSLEDYDKIISFLDENRQTGALSKLSVASGN